MLGIVGSPREILPDRLPAAASHKGCWANIKKKDPQKRQYEEIKNYQEEGSTITQILQSIENKNQARHLKNRKMSS